MMNKKDKTLLILLVAVMICIPFESLNYAYGVHVPPTPAISKIFLPGNKNITANIYNDNFTLKNDTGVMINSFSNHTIEIGISKTSQIVSNISLLNQSTVNGTTNLLYTAPTNGVYRVSVYEEPQIAGSSGTISTLITWTDQSAQTRGLTPAPDSSLNGNNHFSQGSIYIDVQGTTNITYQVTIHNPSVGETYNLFITVEKLS